MNVTFWLGIILFLVALWFLACFTFKPLGKFLGRIFNDAVESLEIKNEGENE